jgi:hypothetical protein
MNVKNLRRLFISSLLLLFAGLTGFAQIRKCRVCLRLINFQTESGASFLF